MPFFIIKINVLKGGECRGRGHKTFWLPDWRIGRDQLEPKRFIVRLPSFILHCLPMASIQQGVVAHWSSVQCHGHVMAGVQYSLSSQNPHLALFDTLTKKTTKDKLFNRVGKYPDYSGFHIICRYLSRVFAFLWRLLAPTFMNPNMFSFFLTPVKDWWKRWLCKLRLRFART